MATNLDDGTTITVCPVDVPVYALTLVIQATEGMTVEAAESIGELLDMVYANDPRKPKATGKRRKETVVVTSADVLTSGQETADGDNSVSLITPCAACGYTHGLGLNDRLVCAGCGAVIMTADELGS